MDDSRDDAAGHLESRVERKVRRRRSNVNVGSTVEQYPLTAWSRLPEGVSLETLWQLCGPQVEQHMQRLPLWKVFALVYFEGVAHGSGAERAKKRDADPRRVPLGDLSGARGQTWKQTTPPAARGRA